MSGIKISRLGRWEDMDRNILKNMLNLVSLRDLFWNISRVCRSWQLACWDILFWSDPKTLDLTRFSDALFALPNPFVVLTPEGIEKRMRILKRLLGNIMEGNDAYGFPLERWRQSMRKIVIPRALLVSDKHLLFIAERTPGVQMVMLFGLSIITMGGFARAMRCWKNLTHLAVSFPNPWNKHTELIEEMGKSCPQLTTLEMHGRNLYLGTDVAQVIAKSLPRLTTLRFENNQLRKEGVKYLISNNFPKLKAIHFCECYLVFGKNTSSWETYTWGCRSQGKEQDWKLHVHSGCRCTWHNIVDWIGDLSGAGIRIIK